MKFIHCADLHLDSKIDELPLAKSRQRREEILLSFERLIAFAVDNKVTAVIIAGDMFDTSKISSKTKGTVIHAIKSHPNIDFLYLSGNHDESNFIADLEEVPENLKIFGNEWAYFNYGDTVITGVVFDGKNNNLIYDTLSLLPEKKNVVVLHGQVAGYKSNENAEIISVPKLKDKNIDYLALGHIHSFSEGVIDNRGKYVYCGCLNGRGFDELGEKGFVLIDTDGRGVSYDFVPFSDRQLYDFEYDVTGKDNWFAVKEEIISTVKGNYAKSSLIKVVIKGKHDAEFEVDKNGLALRLNENFFFAKVYDRTELEINIEDYATDKSVKGEFIRCVFESDLSPEMKSRVIMCGLSALKGEEFSL